MQTCLNPMKNEFSIVQTIIETQHMTEKFIITIKWSSQKELYYNMKGS